MTYRTVECTPMGHTGCDGIGEKIPLMHLSAYNLITSGLSACVRYDRTGMGKAQKRNLRI